jgi:prepilin peptidase CpaA
MSAMIATLDLFISSGHGRGLFISLLCFSTLLLAAGFDSATGRIPNPITYTAILLGLALNSLSFLLSRAAPGLADHWLGAAGPTHSLYGFLIFGLLGVVSRLVRGLGGGDMKLLAAVGALLGNAGATDALLAAMAVAVVYSLVNFIAGGRVNAEIRTLCRLSLAALCPKAALPEATHDHRNIPLAIPMFFGLFLSLLPPVGAAMGWLWGT